jgi:hypothetical protein
MLWELKTPQGQLSTLLPASATVGIFLRCKSIGSPSPHAADLDDGAHDIAAQASAAWEAVVCWQDEYAVKRLAEVRAV